MVLLRYLLHIFAGYYCNKVRVRQISNTFPPKFFKVTGFCVKRLHYQLKQCLLSHALRKSRPKGSNWDFRECINVNKFFLQSGTSDDMDTHFTLFTLFLQIQPSLKIEYLESRWECQSASFI